MEMPEGWKRLNEQVQAMRLPTDNDWYLPIMLNLMKEMAEALEICHSGANVFDEKKEEYLYPCDVALAALKKWRAWK